jgi:hypothetical protein
MRLEGGFMRGRGDGRRAQALKPEAHAMGDDDTLRRLRALNARFIHNFVTNDVASHDRILHERFVCIGSDGARRLRPEYLKRWATGFDPKVIVYWDYRDERIAVFGTVALVSATNKHVVVRNGSETVGMTAYTDTYVLEGGAWTCIQAQLTPVSPEHYPPDDTIVARYVCGVRQP